MKTTLMVPSGAFKRGTMADLRMGERVRRTAVGASGFSSDSADSLRRGNLIDSDKLGQDESPVLDHRLAIEPKLAWS